MKEVEICQERREKMAKTYGSFDSEFSVIKMSRTRYVDFKVILRVIFRRKK